MLKAVKIEPGQNITLSSGTYHIENVIDTGGFGTVFKGQKEDKTYAIKLIRIWELLPDDREDIKRRIELEFKISNTIHSEHIVHTYSSDELHDNPVLVMDYCPDGSLRRKIGTEFSQDELIKTSVQILSGLNILHSYDIIHRDVKPENILFKGNTALLTDFGISANLRSRVTKTNILGHALKVFATLSYSPPEQSHKTYAYKYTAPTNDIFSFGVILYELITKGSLPFGNVKDFKEDPKKIDERKTQGNWDINLLRKKATNKCWIDIIGKCLDPVPTLRYQSAVEIIDALTGLNPSLIRKKTIWKLIITEGSDVGKEFNLTNLSRYKNKRILTIGRFDEGKLRINDISITEISSSYISKRHGTLECIIEDDIPVWYIRDGQWCTKDNIKGWYTSTNGIKVDDTWIDQSGIKLNNNDIIKIGKVLFRVICE
jgi:serine/threonine protein kinase